MGADKIVFDIETKNSFADVGGDHNIEKLEVSVVGAYSYAQDKYFCFNEYELDQFVALVRSARLLIGFSSKRFDAAVLKKHFPFNIATIPHFDILEEIEKVLGRRIGLGVLAEANLGIGKTGHGLEAIDLYRRGDIQKLKDYCVNDVKITKDIFELIKNRGFLWIPERGIPQMKKIEISYHEEPISQASLI